MVSASYSPRRGQPPWHRDGDLALAIWVRAMTINSAGGGVKFTNGRIAEIVLDRFGTTEHVLGAMDLVRLMLQAGLEIAK
jgi:hypothetical protein